MTIAKRILNLCLEYTTNQQIQHCETMIETRTPALEVQGDAFAEASNFTKAYCTELMYAYGTTLDKILTFQKAWEELADKKGTQAKENKRELEEAQTRQKILEVLLFETFTLIASRFKTQLSGQFKRIAAAKIFEWFGDVEDQALFYRTLSDQFDSEDSLPRTVLQFCHMIQAINIDENMLEMVAEALKDCAQALESYILVSKQIPYEAAKLIQDKDLLLKLVNEYQRTVCYTIGHIANRLIRVNQYDKKAEEYNLSRLTILQGGIEQHLLPGLSPDTKKKISASLACSQNKQLKKLALQNQDEVSLTAADGLLVAIINPEKSTPNVELVIQVLQQGLLTKQPACLFAKLGGTTWGIALARAAFSVLLKYTTSLEFFMQLMEDLIMGQFFDGDDN